MKPIDIDKIDKLLADVHTAFIHVQSKVDDVLTCDVNSNVRAEIQRLIADILTAENDDDDVVVGQCSEEGGYTVYYTSIIADIFAAVSKMETPQMTCKDCSYFEPVCGDSLLGRCTQAKAWYENRCIWDYCSSCRTTETAEPQPDGIQFRTVDAIGRICLPRDTRDKLGIKPGTECAVYSTDELTPEQIIVVRRK